MPEPQSKSLDEADEVRPFEKGMVQIAKIDAGAVERVTFNPGWKWSECIKPIVGTDSCQADHFGYQVSGRMHVRMDDGTEIELGPGQVTHIPPGHDAWVVGDEPVVGVTFTPDDFAKPK